MDNPSLPLTAIMGRLYSVGALFALAPASNSPFLYNQVLNISQYITDIVGSPFSSAIKVFPSQGNMEDYMTDKNYDDEGYGDGKIAMAIVLYDVDPQTRQWDYAIRTNFSYPWEQNDPSVACLYGDISECPFTYSIPSTQFFTQDLYKPQDTSFLYGYTYSGFSTLQLLMDQYIFDFDGFDVNIMASIGKNFFRIRVNV